jgi:hypothetical protein|tara:strand:- start:1655 stop:1903 length:249 start_codon:yes stop_codon:yes gene_type:complete
MGKSDVRKNRFQFFTPKGSNFAARNIGSWSSGRTDRNDTTEESEKSKDHFSFFSLARRRWARKQKGPQMRLRTFCAKSQYAD